MELRIEIGIPVKEWS